MTYPEMVIWRTDGIAEPTRGWVDPIKPRMWVSARFIHEAVNFQKHWAWLAEHNWFRVVEPDVLRVLGKDGVEYIYRLVEVDVESDRVLAVWPD